jgi:hypothetical protein
MASALKFTPGSSIRWRGKRYVVVDYAGMDSLIARELGKRRLERIAVRDAAPDRTPGDRTAWTADLVSIPEGAWQRAVKRFKVLKPLLEMDRAKRTLATLRAHFYFPAQRTHGSWEESPLKKANAIIETAINIAPVAVSANVAGCPALPLANGRVRLERSLDLRRQTRTGGLDPALRSNGWR